jgi:hypothetical protein
MASADSVRHQLGQPDLTQCRSLAVQQISHVQQASPANQLNATAIALVAMSEACGLDPFEAVAVAKRVMSDVEGPFTHQIQAIRDYAASELRRV